MKLRKAAAAILAAALLLSSLSACGETKENTDQPEALPPSETPAPEQVSE